MEQSNESIKPKTSPKDFFIHLLSILSLYFSAVAFLVLVFQFINLLIPDVLTDDIFSESNYLGDLRWSLASLIIVFPVYLLSNWFLDKSYTQNPEKRLLRIRKWLIYFTLFATAVIIIGDLVMLLYAFLGGEITMRFVYKVITVFFVTASIFFYYFWDLKLHHTE